MEVNQGKSIKQNQRNQFNPEPDKIRDRTKNKKNKIRVISVISLILSQTKFAYEKILAADPVIIRR